VHKQLLSTEGNAYKAWLQLDFSNKDESGQYKVRKYYDSYRFNLEQVANKLHQQLSFREFGDPASRERVIQSLEKGNRQAVNARVNGEEKYIYLEANPQFKSLNVLDKDYRKLRLDGVPSKQLSESSAHITSRQLPPWEQPPSLQQGPMDLNEERRNGLLEKKRSSQDKGLIP
jgi:hypothetical protein